MEKATRSSGVKLMIAGALRFGIGMILLGLILFLCAGSLDYRKAWLYLITFSGLILAFGVYLLLSDQELLAKRLNTKENESQQKIYILVSGISFILTFCISGWDYRFGWSTVPRVLVLCAWVLMVGGYGLFVITIRQNRFASRVVEVQEGQKVIDTGVYSLVRHPLYSAAVIMFFASPVVLGSYVAIIPMLFYLGGIIARIKSEEELLAQELPGYKDYLKKVKYRLIPYIW